MTNKTFLDIAECISRESKCVALQVGAIIVKDDRLISTGYNGTAKGFPNCNECLKNNDYKREDHHEWSKVYEIHAEMNAIIFAARHGISIEGATLYCTHCPCDDCIKNIVQSGIKHIIYKEGYRSNCCTSKYRNMIDIKQYIENTSKTN